MIFNRGNENDVAKMLQNQTTNIPETTYIQAKGSQTTYSPNPYGTESNKSGELSISRMLFGSTFDQTSQKHNPQNHQQINRDVKCKTIKQVFKITTIVPKLIENQDSYRIKKAE